jgi:hypothetical protein
MRVIPTVALIASVLATASATEGAQRLNPYANLFAGQLNGAPTPQTPPTPAPQFTPRPPMPALPAQTVVCGMTVMQGDSKIDPKMPQHPPANAPRPTIRIMPAPACRK